MPSELEAQKARKQETLATAFQIHNQQIQEDRSRRRRYEQELRKQYRENKRRHEQWQEEQQQQADEGGWLSGALQGAGTGLSLGMMSGNPLVGGLAAAGGALFGGIYGATQGRQAVQEMAPYTGAVSQIAGGVAGMRASQERNQKLLDFYERQKTQYPAPGTGPLYAPTGKGTDLSLPANIPGGEQITASYSPTGSRYNPIVPSADSSQLDFINKRFTA